MAKGMKCPSCGGRMSTKSEKKEPAGSWVVYYCDNTVKRFGKVQACKDEVSVFEDK